MKIFTTIVIALFLTTGLVKSQDTLYMYKAGVVMSKRAVVDMDSVTFIYRPPATGTVIDIDGNTYHWIKIGTQTWMVENLKTTKFRTGESISNISDPTSWQASSFAALCDYGKDPANSIKYGKLYNWYAVNDSRNIAPVGWHIPSDGEWTILENYLIANGGNYDGTSTGSKIGKALSSTTDWPSSTNIGDIGYNLSLNNSSGFSALPARWRTDYGSDFFGVGSCSWWSSTNYNTIYAWTRQLDYGGNTLRRSSDWGIGYGLSVRCIKD